MTTIGERRHRIEILAQSTQQDGYGQRVEVWQPVASTWAAVEAQSGGEGVRGGGMVGESTYRVTILRRSDVPVTPKNRLRWQGRTLEVSGVVETLTELILTAKEAV